MLIKLTDQCSMGCPHCMEDARETGNMMQLDTFKNAVQFGLRIGSMVFTLSGGEPTENPLLLEMCYHLNSQIKHPDSQIKHIGTFTIVSNGMWLKDQDKCERIKKICKISSFAGMQVYSNRRWYKEFDYVVAHRAEYEQYPHVIVNTESPIFMQDLGRARDNKEAQVEVDNNPYFMSCLNTALLARQTDNPRTFGVMQALHKQFCKPSVDAIGDVHMSESRLCPNVGNVIYDSFDIIWQNMRKFKPCGKCSLYNKFLESNRPDIIKARRVLGL